VGMLMIEVTIKVTIKVMTVVTDSVIVVMEVTEVMIADMTVVTTEVMVVEAMSEMEVMVVAEGAVVPRAISEKVIGNVNPVVLTTLPDVRNVSNVTLVKVVVEEEATKDHLTVAAVVGLMSEMEIGSVIAAVITLLSVWNALNVKNLKCEHVILNRKWNC